MLSTPLISCSIGDATVSAITSAEAPAKLAFTTTVGGAMFGYSVIGSARYEMTPTSVMRIEITPAKIGRSTQKWENRMTAASRGLTRCRRLRRRLGLAVLGLDLTSRPRPLQPVDHDAVGGGEPRADHAQAIDDRSLLDELGADSAVVRYREHDLA